MSAIVEVKLKKPYMNIPKDTIIRVPQEKADILVKRKTGVIEGKQTTYTEQEVESLRNDDKKEINRLGLVLDEFALDIKEHNQVETDMKKTLKEERRKVTYFENRLKRYEDRPEPESVEENKSMDEPPKNKMMKGDKSVKK